MQMASCCVFAMWRLCIVCLCLNLIVYICHFPFLLSSSAGKQKICLIILNQPLDKDYLHILWSKGTISHTSPTHIKPTPIHITQIPSSLVCAEHVFPCYCFFCPLAFVASTAQNLNCCHVIENAPSLPSAHIFCGMRFNEAKVVRFYFVQKIICLFILFFSKTRGCVTSMMIIILL